MENKKFYHKFLIIFLIYYFFNTKNDWKTVKRLHHNDAYWLLPKLLRIRTKSKNNSLNI